MQRIYWYLKKSFDEGAYIINNDTYLIPPTQLLQRRLSNIQMNDKLCILFDNNTPYYCVALHNVVTYEDLYRRIDQELSRTLNPRDIDDFNIFTKFNQCWLSQQNKQDNEQKLLTYSLTLRDIIPDLFIESDIYRSSNGIWIYDVGT